MSKQSDRLWIVALLLGWFFDFLFWEKTVGINFPIFTSLCLLGGFFLLRSRGLRPAQRSLWLLLPFTFFAVMTFIRREPLTSSLAYTFTLFPLGLLAVTYLGGRWMQYNFLEYFNKVFQLIIGILSHPLAYFFQVREERVDQPVIKRNLPIWPVVRGLLIAIPIVIFFAWLLASADLVFSLKLGEFLDRFDPQRILEYILRLMLVPFYAYFLAGVFLHSASQSKDKKLLGEDQPVIKPFLGMTETSIVLASVAILFTSFVLVQFRYFFGGEVNIGVEGYTYSQYARRGFNELLAVAFFNLLMILGLSTITKRENEIQKRIYSGLSIIIVAQVIVILVSSYHRLTLANLWHGFSRLRLYPQIFLIWLGLLFVAVVVLEIFHHERYFVFAAVLASFGFAVSLSVFNVDASIVHHNVLRAVQGKHFNVTHLAMLSTDAVPALAEEFEDISLPTTVHEGIGAALFCHAYAEPIGWHYYGWQSFHLSEWRAHKALEAVQAQLEAYSPIGSGWTIRVRTPGNIQYLCYE